MAMKKKVLLMGASGSGKTSMRSVIFNNNIASLTARLGATIDVEQNLVRFFGDLILNLWDCGGQDVYMESYLSTQKNTIFANVGVLIYVFDVGAGGSGGGGGGGGGMGGGREGGDNRGDPANDRLGYFTQCIEALERYSPDARVFVLVHKMDLVQKAQRAGALGRRARELEGRGVSGNPVTVFGTSIYDESLYKAWSRIVHTLIPNAQALARHLTIFAEACSATEVILFERTTFLVVATSDLPNKKHAAHNNGATDLTSYTSVSSPAQSNFSEGNTNSFTSDSSFSSATSSVDPENPFGLDSTRYERTSELVKAFKYACSRNREEFKGLEVELPEFTAVLDELTKNTYVMVVVHDPTIETAAIRINIRLARQKFEDLQRSTTG